MAWKFNGRSKRKLTSLDKMKRGIGTAIRDSRDINAGLLMETEDAKGTWQMSELAQKKTAVTISLMKRICKTVLKTRFITVTQPISQSKFPIYMV